MYFIRYKSITIKQTYKFYRTLVFYCIFSLSFSLLLSNAVCTQLCIFFPFSSVNSSSIYAFNCFSILIHYGLIDLKATNKMRMLFIIIKAAKMSTSVFSFFLLLYFFLDFFVQRNIYITY